MPASDQSSKTDRWIDEFKSREIRPSAQIILAWDGFNLIVEAASTNGAARDKVEGISLTDLPGELQFALIDQLAKIKKARDEIRATEQRLKIERADPQIERERQAQEAGRERLKKRQEWIDTLPEPKRTYEQEKFDKALARAEEEHAARARSLWLGIARDHDIALANRVIDDPKRRPRRRVIVINSDGSRREVSPQSGKSATKNRFSKSNLKDVKSIDIDF